MGDLIDTTEMYLRTIFELEEESITPMRARIAERLSQSGPTVSQTVARMERDGLVVVSNDRHLELTPIGRETAMRVMRKHRIAECMLVDLLEMPWEEVHAEACRWEHVMSESVERRLLAKLGNPTNSPYGNPIPGLDELGAVAEVAARGTLVPLSEAVAPEVQRFIVRRIAEPIQDDGAVMTLLRRIGAMPGESVKALRSPGGIEVGSAGEYTELPLDVASHVLVESA